MSSENDQALFEQAKNLIDQGDVDMLGQLLDKHPALCTARNNDLIPPTFDNAALLYATSWPGGRRNGAAVVKLLVDRGADPMLRFNGDGETVLHWAASIEPDREIVEVLIDCGADVNADGGVVCNGTPLMNALYFGLVNTATLLLSKGASIHNMIVAAGLGRIDLLESWHTNAGQYLCDSTRRSPGSTRDNGKLLPEREAQTWTHRSVICALVCEQYHVVDWFIDHGFDLDLIPDEIDWSCLHHAAYWGSLPMAMYLVSRGADLHVTEAHNANPAGYALAHVHPDVMNYLIDAGTCISMEQAAYFGRLDKIVHEYSPTEDNLNLLVQTIGNKGPIGKPIHQAIKQGRVSVARYLLQKEPGLQHQLFGGKSATSLAEECEDQFWLSSVRGVCSG